MLWNPFRKQRVEAQIAETLAVSGLWDQVQTMLDVTTAQVSPKISAEPEKSAVEKTRPKVLISRRDFENSKIRHEK